MKDRAPINELRKGPSFSDLAGHSRLDILAICFAVVVVVLTATACLRESATSAIAKQCATNMKELGAAMALYERDHDDRLPHAFIKYSDDRSDSVSWDTLIFPYIGTAGSILINSKTFDRKQMVLLCPADRFERRDAAGHVRVGRTYSMSRHDMSETNWPPGRENRTRVGLW